MAKVVAWVLLLACSVGAVHTTAIDASQSQFESSQSAFTVDQPRIGAENSQDIARVERQYLLRKTCDDDRFTFLSDAVQTLDVMQADFFELWIGTWPQAIDWTAAVVNTHVSVLLGTLARFNGNKSNVRSSEIIHHYFSHNIAYYFGENAFDIRNEAYDDMLWVVLGWLESVKFIRARNVTDATWHGTQFIPAFAHRARIFWDLASHGWDTSLCGGGMTWNPRLEPYKNAITNQLFISASIAMYLDFPGDTNDFPYQMNFSDKPPGRIHDYKYLKYAVDGYSWLKNSNMTNSQGLYVDGFHILHWGVNGTSGTGKCDERNEIVYTYNQGVILSGLRGLWEATGDSDYLDDGFELVHNVIKATGWSGRSSGSFTNWAGLGQNGVLEEACDQSGTCSQDSQTFKGIFFQHLTQFCMPLPLRAVNPGKTHGASKILAALHRTNCLVISGWVTHNAKAALESRDDEGKFGTWWGSTSSHDYPHLPPGAVDYRNNASILLSKPWARSGLSQAGLRKFSSRQDFIPRASSETVSQATDDRRSKTKTKRAERHDVNDRGRGRTVETQSGGLAVLRAAWEMSDLCLPHD